MCKADTVTEPFTSSTPIPFFVFLFMFFSQRLRWKSSLSQFKTNLSFGCAHNVGLGAKWAQVKICL